MRKDAQNRTDKSALCPSGEKFAGAREEAVRVDSCSVVWLVPVSTSSGAGFGPLERIDQYRVYQLAMGIRPVSALTMQSEPFAIAIAIADARKATWQCLEEDNCLFQSSRTAAQKLVSLLDNVWAARFVDSETGSVRIPDTEIADSNWKNFLYEIWRAINAFETLLAQDFATQATFSAPRRSIYDTEHLVNSADQAIPRPLALAVSEMASLDLVNAGRCLAFGLYTAAGFHICRAVEAVIEDYYRKFCGKAGTLRSWNDYIVALRGVPATASVKPEQETIAYLDAMRKYNRNEIAHPRVVLDEAEALKVFDLGKAVICAMAQELLAAGTAALPSTGNGDAGRSAITAAALVKESS
jgi:hypothetical protein